jgi:hypothetical protein
LGFLLEGDVGVFAVGEGLGNLVFEIGYIVASSSAIAVAKGEVTIPQGEVVISC